MRLLGILLVGATETDVGSHSHQGRALGLVPGRRHRRAECLEVVALVHLQHVPAQRPVPTDHVLGEGEIGRAVDRDAVVVVEHVELAEAEMPRQRARLRRHTFHQVAIAGDHPGLVVDDLETFAIESRRQPPFGDRHPHRVAHTLSERTGRGLHPGGVAVFRMAGRLGVQLPKVLQLFHRQVVTTQVQQRVDQCRGMATGEHETVAVGPLGICRIVAQKPSPEGVGHGRLAHGRSRMTTLRGLHHVHREETDGVDGDLGLTRIH